MSNIRDMNNLHNKNVIVGVTGGIAAYKAAELTRLLIKQGADVRVVMTPAAKEFVQPLTFQALSGHKVTTDLLDEQAEAGMGHIEMARWADAIIVAPASADFIAHYAMGFADNVLLAILLASHSQVFVAPAMNEKMYHKRSTQSNLGLLVKQSNQVLGPASGEQACGDVGLGRMLEANEIVVEMEQFFMPQILQNKNILITAGPTHEALDPVRYLANKSSGKMGYELAKTAIQAGANVTLVSGPVNLSAPIESRLISVTSAEEMYQAVMNNIDSKDIFIACAAVADYRPKKPEAQKIKKTDADIVLPLSKTKDILAAVGAINHSPFSVGFAAETQNLQNYAQDKLIQKSCDMICANQVGLSKGGFGSDENEVIVFWRDGQKHFKMQSKSSLAQKLITLIAERYTH